MKRVTSDRIIRTLAASSRWMGFRLVVALLAVTVVLGSQLLGIWGQLGEVSSPAEVTVLSAKELYPRALAEARNWQADAYLIWAILDVQSKLPTGSLRASFAFDTPSDAHLGLLVFVKERDGEIYFEREEVEEPLSEEPDPAIEPHEWSIDSIQALEIALANGIEAFIEEYPEVLSPLPPSLTLSRDRTPPLGTGAVRWSASFQTLGGPGLRVIIDPISGAVREIERTGIWPEDLIPVGDGSLRVPSIRELYPQVLAVAREWMPDARFWWIVFTFRLAADSQPWAAKFHAESPTATSSLLIEIKEGEAQPVLKETPCEEACYLHEPVYLEDFPVDNIEALEIALDNGARELILTHERALLEMSGKIGILPDTPELEWSVSFLDKTEWPGQLLIIGIDPVTGEVISVDRA